ncbi:hypothetical protein BST97_02845 [Nonlabens spongiae]|uniref:Uncharacterized protein n=1 Tax=Nonlabens spongiae TaxID=331648 RepID=A0A1W6MHE6_9FLAO|nr:hypothetical protein [Nonlabens spongiae]ARN77021.1 hypothetical protein BST97_02845 [Nonlabens spongiae]
MIRFLKFAFIPLLITGIAGAQLYKAQNGFTRWKGGGFGMYSEMHYNLNQIWLNDQLIEQEQLPEELSKSFKRKPSDAHANLILKELASDFPDAEKLQLWRPTFNLESMTYSRKLVYEYKPHAD